MIQRGGEVVIAMLANVQQATTKPLIKATIAPGSLLYTDEYAIYTPVIKWGYEHKTVSSRYATTPKIFDTNTSFCNTTNWSNQQQDRIRQ